MAKNYLSVMRGTGETNLSLGFGLRVLFCFFSLHPFEQSE